MRLFVALKPEGAFLSALSELQVRLRRAGVTGRYLDAENLHMTLAFIGEWPEDVTDLLPEVKTPFLIELSHIGIFPSAEVLCAGVRPSEGLDNTVRRLRHVLADAGVPFDRKAFTPHITLVRGVNVPAKADISAIPVPPAVMTVNSISLFRSDRGKNGMVYTEIGRSLEFGVRS
ncbi:MAG: RNA 2',3'-cyclic phosphodiesterase [Clostridia bacterium]|nr:RNA 2',3'-cyclic phosphodiesterase [Clostridia bacterium]